MSNVSIKGQVTLPIELRKEFGITAESQVTFDKAPDGIIVRVVQDISEFKGRLKLKKKLDWDAERKQGAKFLAKHRASR
jgi:AbrB family looped-hinge helix DNA binding protein